MILAVSGCRKIWRLFRIFREPIHDDIGGAVGGELPVGLIPRRMNRNIIGITFNPDDASGLEEQLGQPVENPPGFCGKFSTAGTK